MKRRRLTTFIALPVILASLGLWHSQPIRAQRAGASDLASYIVLKNVMVPMRDGVRLATDIYLPSQDGLRWEGKFPAIMERTPYNKDFSFGYMAHLVRHGYAVVIQDTRGRYASEGVWHMMTDDPNDGHDTAEWLVKQPWSDGGFGTLGTSYPGGTQHALALTNPPGLKAMIPVDAVSDAGYFGFRNGGAFELRFMNWIFTLGAPQGSRASRDPATKAVLEDAGRHVRQYLLALPFRKGMTPIRLAPEYDDWLAFAMGHGENDNYWKQPGFGVVDQISKYKDVPVYLIGGWYDSWARQTTMNYMALSRNKKGPIKMILGPWIHGQHMHHANGQVEFGESAAINSAEFHERWYDHWLKGVDNGVENEAPVKIFVMGGGSEAKTEDGKHLHGGVWRDEHEWPLARTVFTPYYLHADGSLSPAKPAEPASHTTYDFDPRNPVPTIGGNISSAAGIMLQGAWDQKCGPQVWNCKDELPLSARSDVLVYMTPPLDQDLEVTGPIDVKLWASSSAVDTDFTAKLIDVHPPTADFPAGIDMNLEDGIIRARFRNSLDKQELMKPGEIYEFTIQLYPTSNLFKAGHRIRLDISSSNFPRFDVNPNTGEPLNGNRRIITATNTIYHDAAHPSHVILPIIPR
ncbi:MAG TPA: CocE/NonD family hydrolase [Terriglobia bacterium]|nr:CocE/NonD family hydrolase [Terriglobia bacterium]